MKSHGRRPILNEKRQLRLDGNKYTPGPGEYQKPSDFGHYDKMDSRIRPKTARNWLNLKDYVYHSYHKNPQNSINGNKKEAYIQCMIL